MTRKHVALLTVSTLLLAGCSASRPSASGDTQTVSMSITAPSMPVSGNDVEINDFAFAPLTLTVATGSTVTWTNRDEEPHTVAANDDSFRSPGMGTGATYSHTFATPGKFEYICSIHPMMHGTVMVTR